MDCESLPLVGEKEKEPEMGRLPGASDQGQGPKEEQGLAGIQAEGEVQTEISLGYVCIIQYVCSKVVEGVCEAMLKNLAVT